MPRFDSDVDHRNFYDPSDEPQHHEDAGDACPCEDCRRVRKLAEDGPGDHMTELDGPSATEAMQRAYDALAARRRG